MSHHSRIMLQIYQLLLPHRGLLRDRFILREGKEPQSFHTEDLQWVPWIVFVFLRRNLQFKPRFYKNLNFHGASCCYIRSDKLSKSVPAAAAHTKTSSVTDKGHYHLPREVTAGQMPNTYNLIYWKKTDSADVRRELPFR